MSCRIARLPSSYKNLRMLQQCRGLSCDGDAHKVRVMESECESKREKKRPSSLLLFPGSVLILPIQGPQDDTHLPAPHGLGS
jgi:hypothetical protein